MARQDVNFELNNFSGGMITEGNPLSSPPNTFEYMSNWDINSDKSISLRQGMKYLKSTPYLSTADTSASQMVGAAVPWEIPSIGVQLLAVVYGGVLYIFNNISSSSTYTYSTGLGLSSVNGETAFSITPFKNFLVVTSSEGSGVTYVTTEDGSTFTTVVSDNLEVRDLFGTDLTYAVSNRPSAASWAALDDDHRYNLLNAGWTETTATSFHTAAGVWPALSDIPWSFKNPSTGAFDFTLYNDIINTGRAPFGENIIELVSNRATQRNSFKSASLTTTADETIFNIKKSAAFAGRIFYIIEDDTIVDTCDTTPRFNGFLCFSQIVKNEKDLIKCYSNNSPTDEFNNQVEETAGGFVQIDGMYSPRCLIPFGNGLLIFAINGVWFLKGTSNGVFSPNNYSIEKISDIGTPSYYGAELVKDSIFFANEEGVYNLSFDDYGNLRVSNISDNTVKSYIQAAFGVESELEYFYIPDQQRNFYSSSPGNTSYLKSTLIKYQRAQFKVRYDKPNNRILFMFLDYKDNPDRNDTFDNEFTSTLPVLSANVSPNCLNNHLILDLNTRSFYCKGYPYRASLHPDYPYADDDTFELPSTVYADSYISDFVTVRDNSFGQSFRNYYLVIGRGTSGGSDLGEFYLATETDNLSRDWYKSLGGDKFVNYVGTLISNPINGGDSQRSKNGNYLTFTMKKEDPALNNTEYETRGTGSIYYGFNRPKNFNSVPTPSNQTVDRDPTSLNSNSKINGPYEIYRERLQLFPQAENEESSLVKTKNKIRGRGESLQFRIVTGGFRRALTIYGYGMGLGSNTKV